MLELIQTFWNGKLVIAAFVAIAVFIGGNFFFKSPAYHSELSLSINNLPPFVNSGDSSVPITSEKKIYIDFKEKFYSKKIFENWKERNSNTSLTFEDFSETRVIDGFVLLRSEDEQLVTIYLGLHTGNYVLVKTNQLSLVFDVFKYSNYVNEVLLREYVLQAKNDSKTLMQCLQMVVW